MALLIKKRPEQSRSYLPLMFSLNFFVIVIKSMSSDVFDELSPHKTQDYVKLDVNQCHPHMSHFLIKSHFT